MARRMLPRRLVLSAAIKRSLRTDSSTMARVTCDATCMRQMPIAVLTIDNSRMMAKPSASLSLIFMLLKRFIFSP